jgi:hypothetical protein
VPPSGQATIAVSQLCAGVHTSWQQLVALVHAAVAGALQSDAIWHCGVVGHGVVVNAHVPLSHHDFGHEFPPPAHAVHAVELIGQSASCMHCGAGQLGYTTSQTPWSQLLLAHAEVPLAQRRHDCGTAGQLAALVHAGALHTGAMTPHTPLSQLAA